MAPKRPAPLTDAAIGAPGSHVALAAAEAPGATAAAATPGATPSGTQSYTVKNTFIDVPSGLTPHDMKVDMRQQLLTAPAELHAAPGFVQRAMAASPAAAGSSIQYVVHGAQPSSPSGGVAAPRGLPLQRVAAPRPSTPMAVLPYDCLATPSPTTAAQRVYSIHSTLAAAVASGPAAGVAMAPAGYAAPPAAAYVLSPRSSRGGGPQAAGQPVLYASQPVQYSRAVIQASPIPWEDMEDEGDSDEDAEGQQMKDPARRPEDAPKPPPGALHPSMGSEGHAAGTCKRCCFFPRGRCTNGYECEFCHYDHEKRKRKNKKKKKKDSAAAAPLGLPQGGQRLVVMPSQVSGLQPSPATSVLASAPADGRPHPQQLAPPPLQLAPPLPLLAATAVSAAYSQPVQALAAGPPLLPPPPSADGSPQRLLYCGPPPQAPLAFAPPQVLQAGAQPAQATYFVRPGQAVPMVQQPHQMVPLQTITGAQAPLPMQPPSPPPALAAMQRPLSPPTLTSVADAAPPPPLVSPTFGQAAVAMLGGPAVPPPMASPKLPRPMPGQMLLQVQ